MESEDFIGLPPGDSPGHGANAELDSANFESREDESQPTILENGEDKPNSENLGFENDDRCEGGDSIPKVNLEREFVDGGSDMEIEDMTNLPDLNTSGSVGEEIKLKGDKEGDAHCILQADCSNDLVGQTTMVQESVSQSETVAPESNIMRSKVHENGLLPLEDATPVRVRKTSGSTISGVKRARITVDDEQQASVHITYNSLTRASKYKLEELLQQWSEWHAQNVSSSQDPIEVVESGEETFFPALHVGTERKSAVSFWMDNQTRNAENMESTPLDSNVPLYDRGYTLGLTLAGSSSNLEGGVEIIDDASRCFNCGSYSHSLYKCPKPRNNAAVNSARKQLKSKRNQNAGSRNSTRYYQNSPAGKYDGLKPGALEAETRKLLGLGELDPPPWLNRMREIGYPPGYLDDDEDQPSGIVIFADEESKEDQEDGEIIETANPERQRKMSVKFPGVNAPIPENADERLWASAPSFSDLSRSRSHTRSLQYAEPVSRGHHREQRWSTDYREDRPPGVDADFTPSSYPPRYGSYAYGYNAHSSTTASTPRSPTFERPLSDRGSRRIHLFNEGSFPYSNHRHSPKDYDSGSFDSRYDESRNEYDPLDRDRLDRYRHHRRR